MRYHGSALDRQTGEVLGFQCRPTLKGLIGQLDNVRKHFDGVELKLCYEASCVGFSLQRDLAERGYQCEVRSDSAAALTECQKHLPDCLALVRTNTNLPGLGMYRPNLGLLPTVKPTWPSAQDGKWCFTLA